MTIGWLILWIILSGTFLICIHYLPVGIRIPSVCSYISAYPCKICVHNRMIVRFGKWDTQILVKVKEIWLQLISHLKNCFQTTQTFHDDVIEWKYFPRNWPFMRGIYRSPMNSRHEGQWRIALMFSLICAWINGWVNYREASDLRRNGAHYDVIFMW